MKIGNKICMEPKFWTSLKYMSDNVRYNIASKSYDLLIDMLYGNLYSKIYNELKVNFKNENRR